MNNDCPSKCAAAYLRHTSRSTILFQAKEWDFEVATIPPFGLGGSIRWLIILMLLELIFCLSIRGYTMKLNISPLLGNRQLNFSGCGAPATGPLRFGLRLVKHK